MGEVKCWLIWKLNAKELYSVCDARGTSKEIKTCWDRRNPLYKFFNMEDKRIEKLKWRQKYILISICLLVLGMICLILSFLLFDLGNSDLGNWWSNALMSLGTGLFTGWTLYVLSNIRMRCEIDINQRLADVDVLYNLGKKVYDIKFFYITYNILPAEFKEECNHNEEFNSAFIAAYDYVENMPRLGNRKVLKTKFAFDYDEAKDKLEKMSTEITHELSYKDVREYLKEIIKMIEKSYAKVEEYKKECETEKNIIKKVPF